ncbi:MAG: hypothetical protein CSA21_00415 [Deltaproteobacteria bacterium]|nr:MAG: hypothetical protein CSA21_00415 [Deltaproteobacteria bacterium]
MNKPIILVCLICVTLILSSCVQPNGTGQKEMIGAGAGAAVGAVLGQVIGRDTAGTLIGAAAGGLLGYVIASRVHMETNQVRNEQATKQLVGNANYDKRLIQVHSESIEPGNQFHAGDSVTVRVSYIVLDPEHRQIPVHEKKTLWFNGTQQAVFEDTSINRTNGTYESLLSFQLPEDAQKGLYQVRHDINADYMADSSLVQFTVI